MVAMATPETGARASTRGTRNAADRAPPMSLRTQQQGDSKMTKMNRRQLMLSTVGAIALALAASAGFGPTQADEKTVTIGIELPLTGADADSATRIKNGALMAIDDTNK